MNNRDHAILHHTFWTKDKLKILQDIYLIAGSHSQAANMAKQKGLNVDIVCVINASKRYKFDKPKITMGGDRRSTKMEEDKKLTEKIFLRLRGQE